MSKANVLIIATSYDAASYHTYRWAQDLQKELADRGHVCFLLDGTSLCPGGSSLADTLKRAEVVVFYGHGLIDRWVSLPDEISAPGTSAAIIDARNVTLLDNRKVYAQCCDSFHILANDYQSKCSNPLGFVGYDANFGFDISNHEHFRDIVNLAAIDFVAGAKARHVQQLLSDSWKNLRDKFATGLLKNRPNAFAAANYADDNLNSVKALP
jgi:hypothetical protein